MRKTSWLFLLLAIFFLQVSAQTRPPMPSQERDNEKEEIYGQFTSARLVNTPEQQRLAYDAAKKFLRKFEGDNDDTVREARRFIVYYEGALRHTELFRLYSAKNHAKTFDMGRALLKQEPDSFYVLGLLAQAGYEAAADNAELNAEALGYAQRALELLASKKATKPDPFKSTDAATGVLSFVVGWFTKDQSPSEAAIAFRRAALADCSYRVDPLTYNLLGATILKGEYQQLSTQYNEKYGGQESSPEQRAMLEKLNQLGARAIDAYARAVALSTGPAQQDSRTKMLTRLTALYKSFHHNYDSGLDDLIATVLSKPLP